MALVASASAVTAPRALASMNQHQAPSWRSPAARSARPRCPACSTTPSRLHRKTRLRAATRPASLPTATASTRLVQAMASSAPATATPSWTTRSSRRTSSRHQAVTRPSRCSTIGVQRSSVPAWPARAWTNSTRGTTLPGHAHLLKRLVLQVTAWTTTHGKRYCVGHSAPCPISPGTCSELESRPNKAPAAWPAVGLSLLFCGVHLWHRRIWRPAGYSRPDDCVRGWARGQLRRPGRRPGS
mmetsp:Transcript_25717/g.58507  ORF Transcript_25717/g.58507 Transcript_25717/m.58507 type:complete len:241 (+) Transcript_25717:1174-1896(+)